MTVHTYHIPPWVVVDGNRASGIAMDDLRAFAKFLPFKIIIEPYPWKRAENTSRAKLPDPIALFPCTPVPERTDYFLVSKQFRTSHTVFLEKPDLLKADKITLEQYKKDHSHTVAVREGHILLQDLKNLGIHYVTASSIDQLMNLLLRGRVEVAFDYDKVFNDYLGSRHHLLNETELQQTLVHPITYGFCINRHSEHAEQYLETINTVHEVFMREER